MFTENQLKKFKEINENEKVLIKTSEEDMKAIREFIKNNPDKVISIEGTENECI